MRLFESEPPCDEQRRKKSPIFALLLIFAGLAVCGGVMLLRTLPRLEKIAASYARSQAGSEIDEAILNYMETNAVTYGKLVDVRLDSEGAIASVTTDTAKIDALIARMDDEIGGELEEKLMKVEIPLNVLLGTDIFAGEGPKIGIHFFPINVVNVNMRHEFVSRGINQTLHTIYIDITVKIEIMLPLRNKIESVGTSVPVAQTLIVGDVPTTYVER